MVKLSVLQTTDIVLYLKGLFYRYNAVSIDYEGDDNYLSSKDLETLLYWIHNNFNGKKSLFYTIAMRSKFDILNYADHGYLQEIINLYSLFKEFKLILVAGHKKYIEANLKAINLDNRFSSWLQILTQVDKSRDIIIGAENMINITKRILNGYSNTSALLLKNKNLTKLLNRYFLKENEQIGIYSLLIDSKENALNNEYLKSYLLRREVKQEDFRKEMHNYTIEKTELKDFIKEVKCKYLFLFSVEGF